MGVIVSILYLQKTKLEGFLMFSKGTERENFPEMRYL